MVSKQEREYNYNNLVCILTNTLLVRPSCPILTGLPFNRMDIPKELREYGFVTLLLFFLGGVLILAGMLID